mgnify:CR=1 FL=1
MFSGAVGSSSFGTDDVTQVGTATGVTWALSTSDNITWSLTATAVGSSGTIIPSIAADRVVDAFGNNNSAATSTDKTVTYDITVPTVAFASLSPANPSSSLAPTIRGTVSEASTVTLYYDSSCSTAKSAVAGNTAFASPGITVSTNVNSNTTTTIYAKAIDSVGNTSTCTQLVIYSHDGVSPTVTSVTSGLADGTYKAGQVVPVSITFSEVVTVTGTPKISLETGTTDAVVAYTSGSGSNTLTFNYTVFSGDTSADLDYISTTALALDGGTIKDHVGNNAALSLPAPGTAGSLGANKALVIDTAPPSITFSSISPVSPGSSRTPQVVVNTSEAMANIQLYSDATCTSFVSSADSAGVGSKSITTSQLAANTSTSLYALGTDIAGNSSACTLMTTYLHDDLGATISYVTSTSSNGAYGVGNQIVITIRFSEPVYVTGVPQLTLETGASDAVVNYASGSGSNTLTFNYTVLAGQTSADLDYQSTTALSLNLSLIHI